MMNCTKEVKGYCETRGQTIPLSFCKNKCKYRKFDVPELPSMPRMAINLAVATVKHIGNKMKERTGTEQEIVLNICEKCDKMIYKNDRMRCTDIRCGCVLENKVKWESSHCPTKKW